MIRSSGLLWLVLVYIIVMDAEVPLEYRIKHLRSGSLPLKVESQVPSRSFPVTVSQLLLYQHAYVHMCTTRS